MIMNWMIMVIFIGRIYLKEIKITFTFEPVEDKPGYYWFNRRTYQIISKEVLEELFKNYDNKDIVLLPNKKLHT